MPTSTAAQKAEPNLPFPIFKPSASILRYLLYDISHITYLRSHHAILGVLIGTLPQIPQQSVFLGLPLELLPEEVQLLVDKGIAYIVNDREWHDKDFRQETGRERESIVAKLKSEGLEIAKGVRLMKNERTRLILQEQARGRQKSKGAVKEGERPEGIMNSSATETEPQVKGENEDHSIGEKAEEAEEEDEEEEETLFDPPTQPPQSQREQSPAAAAAAVQSIPRSRSRSTSAHEPKPWGITPTTSTTAALSPPPPSPPLTLSKSDHKSNHNHAFPLYAHLHSQTPDSKSNETYHLTPGLRFGSTYSVYPGDPLRFHAHYLATAYHWTQARPLVEIVSGGRLGTAVKKGWLIGGLVQDEGDREGERGGEEGEVRCFCVEWGGM